MLFEQLLPRFLTLLPLFPLLPPLEFVLVILSGSPGSLKGHQLRHGGKDLSLGSQTCHLGLSQGGVRDIGVGPQFPERLLRAGGGFDQGRCRVVNQVGGHALLVGFFLFLTVVIRHLGRHPGVQVAQQPHDVLLVGSILIQDLPPTLPQRLAGGQLFGSGNQFSGRPGEFRLPLHGFDHQVGGTRDQLREGFLEGSDLSQCSLLHVGDLFPRLGELLGELLDLGDLVDDLHSLVQPLKNLVHDHLGSLDGRNGVNAVEGGDAEADKQYQGNDSFFHGCSLPFLGPDLGTSTSEVNQIRNR